MNTAASDRQVVVDRPDITGREHILRVHARTIALEDEINLRQIAAMTSGFVGADLANLVNEAALLAARKGKDKVGTEEVQEGVERVIAGPEKKQRVLPRRAAVDRVSQAGRPGGARSLPRTDPVHKISILGRGNGGWAIRCTAPRTIASCIPRAGSRTPSAACWAARSPRRSSTARSPTAAPRTSSGRRRSRAG